MSEKVRRIRSREETSSLRKRVFLIVGFVVVGVAIFVFGSTIEKPQRQDAVQVKNQKMAAVSCVSGECFQVNSDGVAFAESLRPQGPLIFVVEYFEKDVPEDTLAELLFLRKRAEEELGVTFTLAKANEAERNDFDLETIDGWLVRVSTANNANATLEILKRVLDELGSSQRNVEYIDLRLPSKVYYKLK